MTISLDTTCPRCENPDTIYFKDVEVQSCPRCGLDWWWSNDDGYVVTSE